MNLQNIILTEGGFELDSSREIEQENGSPSAILLKNSAYSSDAVSAVYDQPGVFDHHTSDHATLFMPGQKDDIVGKKVIVQHKESPQVLLDDVPYTFEDTCEESIIEVAPNQIAATVEFIVQTDSENVTFDSDDPVAAADPLFV